MWIVLACERCADVGMMKAGVYRDRHGEILCDPCDDDRDRQKLEFAGDYGRQNELGEVRRKREPFKGAV